MTMEVRGVVIFREDTEDCTQKGQVEGTPGSWGYSLP